MSDDSAMASHVLLVEDDRDTREMYALFLQHAGCDVAQAHNGNQAFSKAIDGAPDVIVTDLALPGIDGFELCRRLKSDERTHDVPVIALTGRFMTIDDIRRARHEGCDAVLIKPCLPETLLSEIQEVVRRSHDLRREGDRARRRAEALRQRAVNATERAEALRRRLQGRHDDENKLR
jgi:DNA-binding response OmpR family regulator